MRIRAIGALAGSAAICMSTAIAATGMSKDETPTWTIGSYPSTQPPIYCFVPPAWGM